MAEGQLAEAKRTFEQSLVFAREIDDKDTVGYSLENLGAIALTEDRLNDAQANTQGALSVREQMKDSARAAESRLQLAQVALEKGSPAEAESMARDAADAFEKQKAIADSSECHAFLARVLLLQGKIAQARTDADRALSLARQSGDVMASLHARLATQAIQAASAKPQSATQGFQAIDRDATHYGYTGIVLEAQLNIGQLLQRSANPSQGRTRLEQLRNDARNKGFLLIARKADAALSSPR